MAGGYTAGHALLGVALLKRYREEFGAEGFFIGCEGIEARIVPAHGEEFHAIRGSAWARERFAGKIAAVANLFRGVADARRLLRQKRTQLVIGVGGYASAGAALAARSLGIPLVIHEANADPGLANRLLARLAARVCIGFEEAARRFPAAKVQWTGNPPAAFVQARTASSEIRFLVAGGSLGSPFLNREAPRLFAGLRERGVAFRVRHLAGRGDVDAIRRKYAAASVAARVDAFIDRMDDIYADSDFVISSAGALTLAELSAAGLPALLVPIAAAANDHQTVNARAYARQTGAPWVAERDWNIEEQADRLEALVRHPDRLAQLGTRVRACEAPDAAGNVVLACEAVLDRLSLSRSTNSAPLNRVADRYSHTSAPSPADRTRQLGP
ncbi:MAG TPA: UDP-N-acetylglucosamine--N-acetylmuramyl-(pentapeptide) pyrophosphoryl-undecaprenol N-acetylglucosamine transferase [Bryobacteraceae bacterium]